MLSWQRLNCRKRRFVIPRPRDKGTCWMLRGVACNSSSPIIRVQYLVKGSETTLHRCQHIVVKAQEGRAVDDRWPLEITALVVYAWL